MIVQCTNAECLATWPPGEKVCGDCGALQLVRYKNPHQEEAEQQRDRMLEERIKELEAERQEQKLASLEQSQTLLAILEHLKKIGVSPSQVATAMVPTEGQSPTAVVQAPIAPVPAPPKIVVTPKQAAPVTVTVPAPAAPSPAPAPQSTGDKVKELEAALAAAKLAALTEATSIVPQS